jgi:ribosome-associated protein
LSFKIWDSKLLNDDQKDLLLINLATRITKEKVLLLQCGESRSQHKNKELAIKRFIEITTTALKRQKVRRATKPSRSSIIRKAENKKKNAAKKSLRKKPGLE